MARVVSQPSRMICVSQEGIVDRVEKKGTKKSGLGIGSLVTVLQPQASHRSTYNSTTRTRAGLVPPIATTSHQPVQKCVSTACYPTMVSTEPDRTAEEPVITLTTPLPPPVDIVQQHPDINTTGLLANAPFEDLNAIPPTDHRFLNWQRRRLPPFILLGPKHIEVACIEETRKIDPTAGVENYKPENPRARDG